MSAAALPAAPAQDGEIHLEPGDDEEENDRDRRVRAEHLRGRPAREEPGVGRRKCPAEHRRPEQDIPREFPLAIDGSPTAFPSSPRMPRRTPWRIASDRRNVEEVVLGHARSVTTKRRVRYHRGRFANPNALLHPRRGRPFAQRIPGVHVLRRVDARAHAGGRERPVEPLAPGVDPPVRDGAVLPPDAHARRAARASARAAGRRALLPDELRSAAAPERGLFRPVRRFPGTGTRLCRRS